MNRRWTTPTLLVSGAVLANVAFTWLGSQYDYPGVLKQPSALILESFRENQTAVIGGFLVLALASMLLAPIAVLVGRLSDTRAMRIAVPIGVAAAVVQVIGLMRWPVLAPGYAADAASGDPAAVASAVASFQWAHTWLGTVLGETVGYLLTATWTALVVLALGRRFAGAWFVVLGGASAALVATGALSPLGIQLVDTANFVGYVLWSVWLVAFAVVLVVRSRPDRLNANSSASAMANTEVSA
jgi:hypothetical protein